MVLVVKTPPAIQESKEMQVQSLGQEDPLEKRMALLSSILVWRIPWAEESDGQQSVGSQRFGCNSVTNTHIPDTHTHTHTHTHTQS